MSCVKPDGTLTENAKAIMRLLDGPLSPEEIAPQVNRPLSQVRSMLRELKNQDLVIEEGEDRFLISDLGMTKLA